jgi:hypothetical protein
MRVLLVTAAAAALMTAGCGSGPAAHTGGHSTSPAPAPVSRTAAQACRRLRADAARHRGVPGIPALRDAAGQVTAPRLAADARTAVRDLAHTHTAPVALALLRDDCARAGVPIPVP